MAILTTYPKLSEFAKARDILESENIPFTTIVPEPAYSMVGIPAIVIEAKHRSVFAERGLESGIAADWVDYYKPKRNVPLNAPAVFENDVFGKAAVMVLKPCMGDVTKLRIIAHISGNLSEVFPYMNALRRDAFYNVNGQTFTFMDEYRTITLYPQRIAIAKADDIVDVWRSLESLRVVFNECWKKRGSIEPSYDLRKKPAALEIYFRLPKTNCGQCGEKGCMAFALNLSSGLVPLFNCKPVFEGSYSHLKDALFEICAGLDIQKE